MAFSPLLGNLKGFVTTRPPLVVFTICIAAFALTTLSLAYFIGHSKLVANPDAHADWINLLKQLSKFHLCISPRENQHSGNLSKVIDEFDLLDTTSNVSVIASASLILTEQLLILKTNTSFAFGTIPLKGWSSCCSDISYEDSSINLSLSFPQNNSSNQDICVTFSGPKHILPMSHGPATCNPSYPISSSNMRTARILSRAADADALGSRIGDNWCSNGSVLKMTYKYDTDMEILLSVHDQSVINLHLLHTSYFLFVMVMTLVCYALIKGRPKMSSSLDKVPLDL